MTDTEFFWNILAPNAAPVISNYHNDFYVHNRAALRHANGKMLWLVHDYGTHDIFESSVLEHAEYWRTTGPDYNFVTDCWARNHKGNETVGLFLVDCDKQTCRAISWEQAAEIFGQWYRKGCQRKRAA